MQFEAAAVSDSCNQTETERAVWKQRKIRARSLIQSQQSGLYQ